MGQRQPMRNLSERVAALSPEKLGLLERRLRQNGKETPEAPISPLEANSEGVPLSFAQERLWFLEQFQPGTPVYNVPASISIPGPLNPGALAWSINEIVQRHEVLRTAFVNRQGRPAQIVTSKVHVELPVHDLQSYPGDRREAETRRIVAQEAQKIFDLTRAPLIRAALLRRAPEDHLLLLTLHHIVADGWSLGILLRELSVLYEAATKGQPSPLQPLRIQYADFSRWQRSWLTGDRLNGEVAYWRERLAGAPALLALPTDRPRPNVQTYAGAAHIFPCSRAVTEQFRQFAREAGGTLFMALLAAFNILLCRYTGQSDLVVGTPIANRNRTELEDLVGFFVNTLALRTDVSGNPHFLEILRRVKDVTLGAYEHQDLPFEKMVEEIQPERNLGHHPVFQVLFALQNTPTMPAKALVAADFSPPDIHEAGTGTAKFDLSVFFRETTEGLMAGLEYNTDLFDRTTIERMARHFESLLNQIAANPKVRLFDYTLLSETERAQLKEWNHTEAALSRISVSRLFEMQADRTPQSEAVEFNGTSLTYRELNRRANQLGHRLRLLGIGPEVCVGSCLDPSLAMSVAVIGIFKAGGVYVPLDPSFPRQRLDFMMENSRMPVILTQQKYAATFEGSSATVIVLDSESDELANGSDENLPVDVDPDNLAYVIYTSGSTGVPKGVAMPHRSLSNLISWQIDKFPGRTGARTLQFVSPSFDVSLQEMFATWCSGGSLILTTEEVRRDPLALLKKLSDDRIERLFLAPVALRSLSNAVASTMALPPLKQIIAAGEQLKITEAVSGLLRRLDQCVLCNQYGPSESHVVSEFLVNPSSTARTWFPPIGRPIANAQLYILDPGTLNLTPVAVPGELCIGGVSLARGYIDNPDFTAEKFIPDPFGNEPGARLYRTGDLARWRSDGEIEFLGRIDQQIKVRGFRIEAGEVESAFNRHPSVKDVAVVARQDSGGEKQLAAYVVLQPEETPNVSELRRFLASVLPAYMVPSVVVFLDALPLTPTGKIDKRALPAPERVRPNLESSFVSPRGPVEETLAKIWADVLQVGRVGVHDSFFDLGGHSLLATQVISRVRDAFQVELPLNRLFEALSVAEFAALIDAGDAIHAEPEIALLPVPPSSNGSQTVVNGAKPRIGVPPVAKVERALADAVGEPRPVATRSDGASDSEILARLDSLSDEQVHQLLSQLLREKEVASPDPPMPFGHQTTIRGREERAASQPSEVPPFDPAEQIKHSDAPAISFLRPELMMAEFQRLQLEAHLQFLHGQHMIWFDAQRRLVELHYQHWQAILQLESAFARSGGTGVLEAAGPGAWQPARTSQPGVVRTYSSDSPQPVASQSTHFEAQRPAREARSAPLSFAQQRLWFLTQLQPGSVAYNIPSVISLPGPVDVRALAWSFNEMIRRHETLRTTFVSGEHGEPVQVVAGELALELPVEDLQRYPAAERQAEVQRWANQESQHIFDLSHGPLIRARLLRLSPQEHLLLVTLHHIVADGWSLGILFRELAVLYEAAYQGKPSPLPPLQIQYADFAQWQRRSLSGERLAAEVRYWRERLNGAPSMLKLPTDRPRPTVPSYAGATVDFHCPLAVAEGLVQISRQAGGTLFMVLLAAFKVLLYRLTGETDLVVGTPIANRNRTELESLIGFFVNQLALRTDLSGDPTFREVLRRVKESTLGAYEHQDLPFEKLVDSLQPVRSLAYAPLFQVVFGLQNNPTSRQRSAGAAAPPQPVAEMPRIEPGTAKIDMTWQLAQVPDGLRGGIEYATDLFNRATIERISEQFRSLLEQIVEDPDQQLSGFRLMGAEETGGHTLTDFPGLEMTQEEFEKLILEIRDTD